MDSMEESKYRCERCGYSSNTKAHMITHLNRKFKCEPVHNNISTDDLLSTICPERDGNFSCEFCNKKFALKRYLSQHKQKCKKASSHTNDAAESVTINNITNNNNNITNNITNVTNNNVTNVTNIVHNHIMLMPFGQEDLDFLFEDKFKQIMKKCIADPMKGVQHIIKLVHFNPQKPEYQNICIPNISRSHALCYDGQGWVISDKDEMMKKLVDGCANTMYTFVNENNAILSQRALDTFDKFDEKHDHEDEDMMTALQRDAVRTIINNQDNVGVRERARREQRRIKKMRGAGAGTGADSDTSIPFVE